MSPSLPSREGGAGGERRDVRAWSTRCALACIGGGSVLLVVTILHTSLTLDEPNFYDYGRRILFESTFVRSPSSDNSKLPFAALAVLPEWLAARTGHSSAVLAAALGWRRSPDEAAYLAQASWLYAGRLVHVLFYVTLCWLVFRCASAVHGPRAGVAATALTAFLPSLLGHAGLVTADAPASCTFFATILALARCAQRPSWRAVLAAGLALGCALLVKYSAIDLIFVAGGLCLLGVVTGGRAEARSTVLARELSCLVLVLVLACAVVNAGFGFQGVAPTFADLACESSAFKVLSGALGRVPLPLPLEYLNGLDMVMGDEERGIAAGNVYLLGRLNRHGFPHYFAVATLVKTPLPFLVLCALRPWRREKAFWDLAMLAPVVVLFVHLSFFFKAQIGIRYLLPAFPPLAVLAAGLWDEVRPGRGRWLLRNGLLASYVLGTVLACPRYLAYFNVLIGRRLNAYRVLADSNVDWGQDYFALRAWEQAHSGERYALNPYRRVSGLVIVPVNDFVGVNSERAYAWLRGKARPKALIGDSYLVFEVPERLAGAP